MARMASAELGSSHGEAKGFPQLKRALDAYRLRRTALAAVALVGFITAIVATSVSIEGHADAGVVIDSSGRIESVSPTGFAWRDGVRAGQAVLSSTRSDAEDGWTLVVAGPNGPILSSEAPVLEALRRSLPFALLGLGAGCLAVGFLRLNREWVLPAACLALAGASIPLFLANQFLSAPVLAMAAFVPTAGLAFRIRRHPGLGAVALVGAVMLVAVWLAAYLTGLAADQLEQARRVLALGGTGLLVADRAVQDRPTRVKPLHAIGLAALALFISTGLGLVYFAGFPAPIIAIAITLGLFALPPLRSLIGRRLELALMSDLRQQVAADVADEERGRLARELHDAPLQELSAVIRRLELVPGAGAETSSLRAIADQIRSVAIDLRPPMLDDLGLGPTLDFLAEQVTTADTVVTVDVHDMAGLDRSSRPPAAVELAMYRIAGEAIANALRHAGAAEVRIAGSIAPDAIDLAVTDDGIGLGRDEVRRASGQGRLGMASMRRRAQAIGADLSVEAVHPRAGTCVGVTWRA